MFIQLPTLKRVEIPLLKALVEMYPYIIAIGYHIVQCTKYILKEQKRINLEIFFPHLMLKTKSHP